MNAKAVERLWSLVLPELLKMVHMLERKYQGSTKQTPIAKHFLIKRCSLIPSSYKLAKILLQYISKKVGSYWNNYTDTHGHTICFFLQLSMFLCQVSIQGMWHILYVAHKHPPPLK